MTHIGSLYHSYTLTLVPKRVTFGLSVKFIFIGVASQNHSDPQWEVPPVTPSDFPPLLTPTECVEHHIRVIWVFDESWLGSRFCTCHSLTNSHTLTHGLIKIWPSVTPINAKVTPIKAHFSDPHQSDPQSPHITSDPWFSVCKHV